MDNLLKNFVYFMRIIRAPLYKHQSLQAGVQSSDADIMKKRAEFFKEQREKLLARKKDEREKLLLRAENDGSQRPCSARAARKTIDEPHETTAMSKEDEKKIQMKRAIAENFGKK